MGLSGNSDKLSLNGKSSGVLATRGDAITVVSGAETDGTLADMGCAEDILQASMTGDLEGDGVTVIGGDDGLGAASFVIDDSGAKRIETDEQTEGEREVVVVGTDTEAMETEVKGRDRVDHLVGRGKLAKQVEYDLTDLNEAASFETHELYSGSAMEMMRVGDTTLFNQEFGERPIHLLPEGSANGPVVENGGRKQELGADGVVRMQTGQETTDDGIIERHAVFFAGGEDGVPDDARAVIEDLEADDGEEETLRTLELVGAVPTPNTLTEHVGSDPEDLATTIRGVDGVGVDTEVVVADDATPIPIRKTENGRVVVPPDVSTRPAAEAEPTAGDRDPIEDGERTDQPDQSPI